ncbi:MAG: ABC-F family ATP-binding cassette domain-containing protein [Gaiellales bacterium]|nr:ABC-F family ATP-binding cassette domain-containing protein [Gaiellales bacterium]
MLHLTDLSKSFGDQVILDRASLHIKPGMRMGLVGPNGAGKTTLLRLICGELSLDGGEISGRKDLRIGFLPQEIEELAGHSVMEEVLISYRAVLDMEVRLKELGEQLAVAQHEAAHALLREMGDMQHAFEAAHGFEVEARAQAVLRGMAFKEEDFGRPIYELSGGWRMRVALARLLLEQPELLLLDEPTNHLDLESLLWLEEFLMDWPGSLVIISHDRYFLNRMVTHIVELDRGTLDLYAGDYDHFETEKRQRYETLVSAARNQQREIDQAETFIRRFRAKNRKAKQVQQRVRQLEKLERISVPELDRPAITFRFPQPGRTGREVAEIKGVRKAYGDNVVYKRLDVTIERGDKIALVGPNGSGKSTLLKMLAGVIAPDGGSVRLGHMVGREYYAQHQLEVLDPEMTVLQTMEARSRSGDAARLRGYLGAFLFTGDDVDKRVSVLSGGEKARLALARMLLDPAGLLLLDEPTNHLDMASRDVLTEALRQFEGSIVFISHDRRLINAIATQVVEVEAGRLTHYLGDWEYYQWKKGRRGATEAKTAVGSAGASTGRAAAGDGDRRQAAAAPGPVERHPPSPGVGYKERKEINRRYRQAEKRILELEERQRHLAVTLSDPGNASDYQVLLDATQEAARVADELLMLYEEWEGLTDTIGGMDP